MQKKSRDLFKISNGYRATQGYEQGVDAAPTTGGTYDHPCSDIPPRVVAVDPERDPVVIDDGSEFTSGINDKNDELGFVALTKEWTDLVNGCPSERYCR